MPGCLGHSGTCWPHHLHRSTRLVRLMPALSLRSGAAAFAQRFSTICSSLLCCKGFPWLTCTLSFPRKGLNFSRQTATLGRFSNYHRIDFLLSTCAKPPHLCSHNLISFWSLICLCLYFILCPVANDCCSSWDLAERLLPPGKCSLLPWYIYFLISPGHSVAL